jgi:hypothetical protein
MKYRQGFDSNCSSMSFVVSKEDFKTMKDLAKAMINYMFDIEQADNDYYPEKERKEYLKALEEAPDVEGLSFASCNYDTYIWEGEDNKYYVDTCNNHNCWQFLDNLHYPDFTIKAKFFDIHTKELKENTMYGASEWF